MLGKNQGQFCPTRTSHSLLYFLLNLERSIFGRFREKIAKLHYFFLPFLSQPNTPPTYFLYSFFHPPKNHPSQTYSLRWICGKHGPSSKFVSMSVLTLLKQIWFEIVSKSLDLSLSILHCILFCFFFILVIILF